MTYSYTFTNASSIDNIPKELKGILEDTIAMYARVVPKKEIVCIFAQGSVTRGNFKPGVSDFDTIAIVRRALTDKELHAYEELRRALESKYEKMGLEKFDGGFVELQRFLAGERPKLNFIFGTDGMCIFGEAPALERTWPDPGNELSTMLNHRFAHNIDQYRDHLEGVRTARVGLNAERWIAKQAVRLLFGITMAQSGEYSSKMEDYREYVKKHLAEELTNFDYLYAAYIGEKVQGDKLLACCEHVLELARARGAVAS